MGAEGAAPVKLDEIFTVSEFEEGARSLLPEEMFQTLFGDRGSPEWRTNDRNIDAFAARDLRARVLIDVSGRRLATTVLGTEISMPVIVAPTGYHQRNHPDGELATARACSAAGTIFTLSTVSSYSIEEVADAASGPLWFQLYFFADRGLVKMLVERAEAAGYAAIVVTVDTQVRESSERAIRFRSQASTEDGAPVLREERILKNLTDPATGTAPKTTNFTELLHKQLTWKDIEWLCSITRLPVVVKGIQSPDDVQPSIDHGARAIIVSNHGGHAMPNARPTLDTLAEVIEVAPAGSLEVLLDGGVRSGVDAFKAVALGARAVLVGRAPLFGLTVGGEAGVSRVLDILRREFDETMRYCGATDARDIDRRLLV